MSVTPPKFLYHSSKAGSKRDRNQRGIGVRECPDYRVGDCGDLNDAVCVRIHLLEGFATGVIHVFFEHVAVRQEGIERLPDIVTRRLVQKVQRMEL